MLKFTLETNDMIVLSLFSCSCLVLLRMLPRSQFKARISMSAIIPCQNILPGQPWKCEHAGALHRCHRTMALPMSSMLLSFVTLQSRHLATDGPSLKYEPAVSLWDIHT